MVFSIFEIALSALSSFVYTLYNHKSHFVESMARKILKDVVASFLSLSFRLCLGVHKRM